MEIHESNTTLDEFIRIILLKVTFLEEDMNRLMLPYTNIACTTNHQLIIIMLKEHLQSYLAYAGIEVPDLHYSESATRTIRKKIQKTHFLQSNIFLRQGWHTLKTKALLENTDWFNYANFISKQGVPTQDGKLPEVAQELVGMLHRNGLFLLHATLNQRLEKQKNEQKLQELLTQVIENKEALLQQLKADLATAQVKLDEQLLTFYQLDLALDFNQANFYQKSVNFSEYAQAALSEIANVSNFLIATIEALQADRKRSFSEKVAFYAAQYGTLSRHLLAAQAGVWHLFLQKSLGLSGDFRASALPFQAGKLPNGKDVDIHKVSQCNEDDFIETRGFVQEVISTEAADKRVVGQVKLYDPSSKKSVWVATPFTHLRHLGIEVGSYLIVHGHVKHQSDLVMGELAIHIDRLPLSELKKSSWKMALLDSAKIYYQAWYNGLNLHWSLVRHEQDLKEAKVLKMGAGELIYQPLYKGQAFKNYRKTKYSSKN